jgi:ligand-binding sensor domain-containing protein
MAIKPIAQKIIHSLLLLLVFHTFCAGQTVSKKTNENVAEQLSFTSRNAKLKKTQGSNQYQELGCGYRDKSGNIWFGTTGEGIYRYDGKVFTQYTKKDGLFSNSIFKIIGDKSGNLWFGSREAITRFDGKKFTNIAIPSSVRSNFIVSQSFNYDPATKNELWSMMQDKSGKFWLGTTDGVYCFDGKTFNRFLDNKKILNTSHVTLKWTQCIYEDKSGNIWFGSWVYGNEGISRYDGKSITQYKPFGEGWIRSISEDKNGTLLFVTRHNGVCRFDGKNFLNFTEKGGLDNASINTIFEDKAGNLWFGTELGSGELNEDGGLWLYNGISFTRFTRKDGLCHNGVFFILEDADGKIWIGTRNVGLCRFDGKTFTSFSE